jgi:hypothetical protein
VKLILKGKDWNGMDGTGEERKGMDGTGKERKGKVN